MDAPPSPASEYSNYDGDANTSYGPWASLIVGQINNQMDHDFDDAQDVETILGQDMFFRQDCTRREVSAYVDVIHISCPRIVHS